MIKGVKPLGEIVKVKGHNMSIYVEGHEKKTIIFLAGSGTASPILDFKSLFSCLSDQFKVIVVEKFGYGFSDIVKGSRDIDVMLEETRLGLKQLKIEPPYILCPHSMSGLEALYWYQKYPKEVTSIIGLDMAVKDTYRNFKANNFRITLGVLGSKINIQKLVPKLAESAAIEYGNLTDREKKLYRKILYERTLTKDMVNEIKTVTANAKKINTSSKITIPVLLLMSNGEGTGFNPEFWKKCQRDFLKHLSQGQLIPMDCGHYIHDIKYKEITKIISNFCRN